MPSTTQSKKPKKYSYVNKTGRPEKDFTGKVYGDWVVVDMIGKFDGYHQFWKLENKKTNMVMSIRQDNLIKFTGKRIDKVAKIKKLPKK